MKTELSFGGGGQTTSMLVLIAGGLWPRPDAILMADTGSERPETYRYLSEHTYPYATAHGLEIVILGPPWRTKSYAEDLERYCLKYHMLPATFNRWCTDKFKLAAMRRYRTKVMGATVTAPIESWIGISTDEGHRAKLSSDPTEIKRYPLIELGMSRMDCEAVIAAVGLPPVPKSGCWFCPFRGRHEYQRLKREEPELFARALHMERNAKPNKHGKARYLPMFGSLESVAMQDEIPGFEEAMGAEAECVTGVCLV